MTDITEQVTTRLTDAEREELSRKVADANKRSEQGRGGGQR
ncbi:hypothetical protein [Streptomyces fimicarius]